MFFGNFNNYTDILYTVDISLKIYHFLLPFISVIGLIFDILILRITNGKNGKKCGGTTFFGITISFLKEEKNDFSHQLYFILRRIVAADMGANICLMVEALDFILQDRFESVFNHKVPWIFYIIHINFYLLECFLKTSLFFTLLLSLNLNIILTSPLLYKSLMTKRRINYITLAIFSWSLVLNIPSLFLVHVLTLSLKNYNGYFMGAENLSLTLATSAPQTANNNIINVYYSDIISFENVNKEPWFLRWNKCREMGMTILPLISIMISYMYAVYKVRENFANKRLMLKKRLIAMKNNHITKNLVYRISLFSNNQVYDMVRCQDAPSFGVYRSRNSSYFARKNNFSTRQTNYISLKNNNYTIICNKQSNKAKIRSHIIVCLSILIVNVVLLVPQTILNWLKLNGKLDNFSTSMTLRYVACIKLFEIMKNSVSLFNFLILLFNNKKFRRIIFRF
ncbi:unnamed protein product [Gordionus sp. m RMFG-2023]